MNEMKNVNEMNIDELKNLEALIKARKAELKVSAKADKADANQAKVDEVNRLISGNYLTTGMNVVILYGTSNTEIVGKVVGVLTTDRSSITVSSPDFVGKVDKNGEKRRYVEKYRFVRIAD